jgi:PTH1 family peptidyl-tRNA hydrolase
MKLVAGLGNPGKEYEVSRHNTGFIVLDFILGNKIDWKLANGIKLLYYKDSTGGKPTEYIKPTTFMNNSGVAVKHVQEKHKTKLKDIVIIYDDLDLPLGKMKISFNRSSGGHNGLESIIKKLKSREFIRIRVGICPETPSGKLRKPKGEAAILKFLMGEYKKEEIEKLKKVSKKIKEALELIFTEGKDKAMSLYN